MGIHLAENGEVKRWTKFVRTNWKNKNTTGGNKEIMGVGTKTQVAQTLQTTEKSLNTRKIGTQ